MAQAGTVWVDVRGDVKGLVGDIDGAARKAGSALGGVGKTVMGDIGRATATLVTGVAALGSVGVASLASVGAEYNTLEQTSRAAFETVLGTAEAAEKMMADLREFGKSSPFPRQAFIEATQQLLAFGYEADQIIPTLGAIQDAVAATGGSASQINEVANVLAKVTSTGKITAENLNELGIRGIDAAALIGEGMNKTADQIRESITEGALDADKAIEVLVEQMGIRFEGGAERVKDTWVGSVDRIKGAWRDIGSDLMEPFISKAGGGYAVTWANDVADSMRHLQSVVIPGLLDPVTDLAGEFAGAATAAKEMVTGISAADVSSALKRASDVVSTVREALEGLEGVAGGVALSIAGIGARSVLGPLGGIVPVISPITGVLGGLVLGSDAGRDALASLSEKGLNLAQSVGPKLMSSLGSLATELSRGLGSALEAVGGAAIDAAEVLGPVLADAIEKLGPPLGDVIEAGGELVASVLPDLVTLAGDLLPPAVDLLGGALGLAADAMGLLTENAWLLAPAIGGLVALKFGDTISDWASSAGEIASALGSAVGDFSTYFRVLRDEGASVGDALRGAASEVGGLSGGLMGLNPAVLGVTAAVGLGVVAYQRYAENKRRVEEITDDLVAALELERDKYREVEAERSRQTFIDKDALDTANELGMSMAELVEVSALYGDEIRTLDDLLLQTSFQTGQFRSAIEDLPGPVREIGEAIADLVDGDVISGRQGLEFFQALDELAQGAAGSMDDAKASFESIAIEARNAGEIGQTTFERLSAAIAAAKTPDELNAAFNEFADVLGDTGVQAAKAEADLQRLQDRLEDFLGIERDAAEMSRRFNESLERTTASFREHGAGIDDSTEAGRANADAVQRMVEQAERFAEQLAKTDETGVQSGRVFNKLTIELAKLRDEKKLTADEYRELLDLYDLHPEALNTRIDVWTEQAKADLAELRDDILATPGITEAETALVKAMNDPVALARVGREIAAVSADRTAWVNVRVRQIAPGFGVTEGFPLPVFGRRASGGPVGPGRWLVGEEGPELLELGAGQRGHVTDADRTAQILSESANTPTAAAFDSLVDEFRALSKDIRALASRPTIGQVNQHGVEPSTAPEDFIVALSKGDHLSGRRSFVGVS